MNTESKKVVPKIILGGVVVKDGKVLILQRHKDEEIYPNMWELPSGKRENLESSEASLVREVREESGLDVEVLAPISTFDYQVEKSDEIQDSTQINFLVRPVNSKEVLLSSEHQAFAWIAPEEINNYGITDATKGVIKKAFEMLSKLGL
ncbi:MAG: NUDIX domain-containing protein [bacterium]|nr:NUDIX domain-containing protein [bacterium]